MRNSDGIDDTADLEMVVIIDFVQRKASLVNAPQKSIEIASKSHYYKKLKISVVLSYKNVCGNITIRFHFNPVLSSAALNSLNSKLWKLIRRSCVDINNN